jgi:MipA family protein
MNRLQGLPICPGSGNTAVKTGVKNIRLLALLLSGGLISQQQAHAGDYQLGVGVLVGSQPHYPGAAQSSRFVLPVPYITYRSPKLQIDRLGASGLLAQGDGWTIDLSLAGALAVDNDDNLLRVGMPALDWIGEAGPVLKIDIAEHWAVHLPVRAAVATDFKQAESIGWRIEPQLRYEREIYPQLQFSSVLAYAHSSSAYHQYFYGVAPQYQTSSRPVYTATSGSSGWRFANGMTLQQGDWRFGVYSRYDYLADAVYADSPLFAKSHQLAAGFVVVRILKTGEW